MPWTSREAAETIARVYSAGLFDLAGRPLIEHNTRVTAAVEWMLADDGGALSAHPLVYSQAAMLHNVLEDTVLQPEDLLYTEVPPRVVACLQQLTRRPGETSDAAIARLVACGDRGALVVKFCDLKDHISTHELALLDRDRCAPVEYTRALHQVRAALRRGSTSVPLPPAARLPEMASAVHY